jgi:inner membrane transporter RhtA
VKWGTDPLGLFWSAVNTALFAGYIVLGHKAAQRAPARAWIGSVPPC